MAWIESHAELANHPKTKRLARLLEESVPSVIGRLHLLWWWCVQYAPDGDLSRWDAADIADACMWDGDPDVLLQALCRAGFVDQTESGYAVHDWEDHAGFHIAREEERRRQAADRQRRYRQRIASSQSENITQPSRVSNALRDDAENSRNALRNATITRESRVSNAPTLPNTHHNPTTPSPNHTLPNTHTMIDPADLIQAESAATTEQPGVQDGVCVSEGMVEESDDGDVGQIVRYYAERTGDREHIGATALRLSALVQQYGAKRVREKIDVIAGLPNLHSPMAALKVALREDWQPSRSRDRPARDSPQEERDPRYEAFYRLFERYEGYKTGEEEPPPPPDDPGEGEWLT